ncbi:MAG: DUF1800 domain-containing protein [Proteobacteria bacterium]|nr:DUF1800 domain-containing protein [Pseudomonadota bacterium]
MVALGRRYFVGGVAALGTTALWPVRPGLAAAGMGFDEARHLLSRAAFGATPAEIRTVATMDRDAAVDRLLATWHSNALTAPPDWLNGTPDEQARELSTWWVEEILATDQPLVERMTLFWHNHFTSSLDKVHDAAMLFRQNALFRREAFGNFARLLKAVARDPAMLIYLDGADSVAGQPNENFARELLELFTLGEGRYSEADVRNAARAFTGWTIDRKTGAFMNRVERHDGGEKSFLGRAGHFDGNDILDILLEQPRTAELVCEKLWREFVSLAPDAAEIERLAEVLRGGGYEMKPVLKAMFLSPAFRDPANRGGLIKSPIDLLLGSVHLLGLPVPDKTPIARMMQNLGQLPFDPPNVRGWPGGESWITTYTLLLRQQYLRRMIEATTVASMDSAMKRPVEGRSLRNAGSDVELTATLTGIEADELMRTLLPRQPIDAVDTGGAPGAVVAAAMLDPVYQLK